MPPGSLSHKILAKLLAIEARAILRHYKPTIIGITGSFGKSSAKEAIAAVLGQSNLCVRKSRGNENTELGVPRTIIGGPPGSSLISWARTLIKGILLCLSYRYKIDERYPETLVLEMAAEHPGDIDYLVKLAPPKIGVMTGIGSAHGEFLGSPEKILAEKSLVITALPKDGTAILNADDALVVSLATRTKARMITFGVHESATVRGSDFVLTRDGFSAKIVWQGESAPLTVTGVVGIQHLYACLAGVATGLATGMDFPAAVRGLKDYQPLPGRMRLIPGVKNTVIIDDSYNANPEATKRALETLVKFPAPENSKRFAILGDMRALGPQTPEYHYEIGAYLAKLGIDYFVAVGELMGQAIRGARDVGMDPDRICHFASSREAGEFIQDRIKSGDSILIKGSQNQIRMERAVYALMAEPDRARELLVRQGKEWENRP